MTERAESLQSKVVVVTGAGGYLGRAMTQKLASLGATVIAVGRTRETLESARDMAGDVSGRIVVVQADVGTDGGLETIVEAARVAGGVDGWVNNAYAGGSAGLLDVRREEVEASVKSAMTDVILAIQAAARAMMAPGGGGGAIVNVASMYGVVSPQPAVYQDFPQFQNPPAYGAAKAGVIQITRYAACHLAPHRIRVNAISPGPCPDPDSVSAPAFLDELRSRVPLGRLGLPGDVGGAVCFLLSDAAGYITGHNLIVDGGWTAW